MDSDRRNAQVERLEVVETGRRRRWSENEKLKIVLERLQAPRQVAATARRYGVSRSLLLCGDGCFALSRRMPPRTKWALYQRGGAGLWGDAWSSRSGQQRGDRDRVYGWGSDADHRHGRRGMLSAARAAS